MIHVFRSFRSVIRNSAFSVVRGFAFFVLLAGVSGAAHAQLTVAVGTTSAAQTATVYARTAGKTASTAASAFPVLTQGTAGLDFNFVSGGTCAVSTTYATDYACTIKYTFTPKYSGVRYGAVQLISTAGSVMGTAFISGIGTGPQVIFPQAATSSLPGTYNQPRSIAIDGAGDVYVANFGAGTVLKIPVGCATSSCVMSVGGGFDGPASVAVDGAGNIYVADYSAGFVTEMPSDCASASCKTYLGGGFTNPISAKVDGSGNVFVVDFKTGILSEIPPNCTNSSCLQQLMGGFQSPQDIALDGSGTMYIADYGASLVESVPVGCNLYNCPFTTLGGGFDGPSGVAVDGNGNVYVGDSGNNAVKVMTPNCTPANAGTCVTTVNSSFSGPIGITLDGGGDLYVADNGHNAIGEIARATAPSLAFSNVKNGSESTSQTVTLTNYGNQPLTLAVPSSGVNPGASSSFSLATTGTGACPSVSAGGTAANLAASASCTLAITFAPVAPDSGTISGSVVVKDDNSNVTGASQTIALSGVVGSPTVTGISPNSGPTGGGTTVTITGTNFGPGATVKFGAYQALSVTVNSPTSITATNGAPPSSGTVNVTVTSGGLTSATSAADDFTFLPPTVTGISPSSGPTAGETGITITGTGFAQDMSVQFGGTPAAEVTVYSTTSLAAVIPPGSAGTVNVTVSVNGNAGATSPTSAADQYTYISPPTVTGVSPSTGTAAGGTSVTISGTGFSSGATVAFGGEAAGYVTVISSTSLTAVSPAGISGAVDVTVTAAGGTSATSSADEFTYLPLPTVTGISPLSGLPIGGTTVTITGTGFASGATVSFGGTAATNVSVKSSTSITATAPAGSGIVDVRVTTGGETTAASRADHFTYLLSQRVGQVSAAQTATVTFATAGTLSTIDVLTTGQPNLDFGSVPGGTCATGTAYEANATCTVRYTFNPRAPGVRNGAVQLVASGGASVLGTAMITGLGTGPAVAYPTSRNPTLLGSGFDAPYGVAVDAVGNVYIADYSNSSVKEIVAVNGSIPASPTIRTLGSGFSNPTGVAVDGAGNVYVADFGHGALKEIVAVGGSIPISNPSILTFSGVPSDGGEFGVAVDGEGNVYVSLSYNGVVDEVAAGSGAVVQLPGTFSNPDGIAVDGVGDVFVADYGNSLVREIEAGSSNVVTLSSAFSVPTSVAVDAAGDVYVATENAGTVNEIVAVDGSIPTSNPTILTLGTGFKRPSGVAVDAAGNVYVGDNGQKDVYEIGTATAPSLSFATTNVGSTSSDSPQTFSFQNVGNANLTVAVPASGTNPAITSGFTLNAASTCLIVSAGGSGVTLAEGGLCTESISFAPISGGQDNGSLTFTDNALNITGSTQKISLSGIGVGVPTAIGISPLSGPVAGGTLVTVTGTNFASGATVSFGQNPATGVIVISATELTALSPAGNAGTIDVTVTTAGGTSATGAADRFTYSLIASAITFPPLANAVIGGMPPTLSATSNSPQPITYTSTTTSVCTVASGVITDLAGGTCSITASQAAGGNYGAATPVSQSYTITVPLVFVAGNGKVASLASDGSVTSAAAVRGGVGVAVDSSGHVWSIDSIDTGISRFTALGAGENDYTNAGVDGASALAIDGNSQVLVANSNGTVSVLSNAGVPKSTAQGSTTVAPGGIAVDISGNVWVTNPTTNTVDEILGGAAPTAPLSMAVTKNTPGVRP